MERQGVVKRFRQELLKHSLTVWFDEDELNSYVEDSMAGAINSSAIFVCCISKNYEDSISAMKEFRYASAINKEILPIRLEEGKRSDAIEFVIAPKFWCVIENGNEEQLVESADYVAKQVARLSPDDFMKMPELRYINIKDIDFTDKSERLGEGAFGVVFRVFLDLDEDAALKKLHDVSPTQRAKREFLEEADIMSKVSHPRIVRLFGIVDDPISNTLGIVMEYVPRGSLFNIIHSERPPLSLFQRLRIIMYVAIGLRVLHDLQIIHKDIKSQNILLDENWRAKVSDFGLARIRKEVTSSRGTRTRSGTKVYMAPELFNFDGQATEASDVFAYAVVVSEVMTWSGPFGVDFDTFDAEVMHQIVVKDKKRPTLTYPAGTPIGFDEFLALCWDHSPKERPMFREICIKTHGFLKSIPKPSISFETSSSEYREFSYDGKGRFRGGRELWSVAKIQLTRALRVVKAFRKGNGEK